jgi:hypothetical protein
MAISEAQASVERELFETRVALAEARAFIADVVEHHGIASQDAARAYKRWLDEHPFDMEAALASMKRSAGEGPVDDDGEDRNG